MCGVSSWLRVCYHQITILHPNGCYALSMINVHPFILSIAWASCYHDCNHSRKPIIICQTLSHTSRKCICLHVNRNIIARSCSPIYKTICGRNSCVCPHTSFSVILFHRSFFLIPWTFLSLFKLLTFLQSRSILQIVQTIHRQIFHVIRVHLSWYLNLFANFV